MLWNERPIETDIIMWNFTYQSVTNGYAYLSLCVSFTILWLATD